MVYYVEKGKKKNPVHSNYSIVVKKLSCPNLFFQEKLGR